MSSFHMTLGDIKYICKRSITCNSDDPENSDQKTKITDTVHDKSFVGCFVKIIILKPVTDQQIRTKSYSFPANEHDYIVGTHHQQQLGKNKKIEIRKISSIMCRR